MPVVTWDSINKGAGVTLSDGDLRANVPSMYYTARANIGRTTGKWYWEIKFISGSNAVVGIVNANAGVSTTYNNSNAMYYYSTNGNKYNGSSSAYGASYTTNDTIGVALNLDVGTIEFYKNGISQGVAFTNVNSLGEVFPSISSTSTSGNVSAVANFGASPFTYEIPKDYFSYDGSQYGGYNKFLISSNGQYCSYSNEGYTENLVPFMTSYTSPSGIVEISSLGAGNHYGWYAFSNNVSEYWKANNVASISNPEWISYDFGKPTKVSRYTLSINTSNTYAPTDFNFEGWDGNNWVVIDSVQGLTWSANEKKTFTLNETVSYSKYRIYVTKSSFAVIISKIEFMYKIPSPVIILKDVTESNFINHGIDKKNADSIDLLTPLEKRIHIENTSETLGSGRVFKTSIDTSKFKIKNVSIE